MKKRIFMFLGVFVLVLALSACNVPTQFASAPQQEFTPVVHDQGGDSPLTLSNNGSGLVISDVQVSANRFYYVSDACGPTEVTVSAKVTSSAAITHVGVQRLFSGDQIGPNGGQADEMTSIGNDRFAFTIKASEINTTSQDNYSLALTIYAEDHAGNQVATGEWGDGVGNGHLWPQNPIQLQIPSLRLEQCVGNANQIPTTQPQVSMPTSTPVPVVETLPTEQPPVPVSNTTQSGYVELGDLTGTGELADMDFNGAAQLGYFAPTSSYPNHSMGQDISQGDAIMMALVSSASYNVCQSLSGWTTSIGPVHAGETYCYRTANNTYGYFHIDKIENRGSEIDWWVISLSYTVWVP